MTTFPPLCRQAARVAGGCLERQKCVCLSLKVNGVSPELSALATRVPIDPTHTHTAADDAAPHMAEPRVCVCVRACDRDQ